ncbi:hypothetical protein SAMD00019534_024460 [Acytostelium subglobosum LB1]|uniref:hypothetical protein n=1 Tax=Acytostelium subglobosum LB1 TaxID=1410327 RepID=UPI00064490D6|nr:hypothetical protein SAMD00019534_024460 [Acytostelium subglobosum LB1]GAM19271.1 hypothetical protein SAMD00019534_024460 [Acytostelium subglobosum LB1]|eukprot:XP_012757198.1 hypothetical protein SAMD00019534_024460 [Acytostelium subglobosum LB1]
MSTSTTSKQETTPPPTSKPGLLGRAFSSLTGRSNNNSTQTTAQPVVAAATTTTTQSTAADDTNDKQSTQQQQQQQHSGDEQSHNVKAADDGAQQTPVKESPQLATTPVAAASTTSTTATTTTVAVAPSTFRTSLSSFLSSYYGGGNNSTDSSDTTKQPNVGLLSGLWSSLSSFTNNLPATPTLNSFSPMPLLSYVSNNIPFPISYGTGAKTSVVSQPSQLVDSHAIENIEQCFIEIQHRITQPEHNHLLTTIDSFIESIVQSPPQQQQHSPRATNDDPNSITAESLAETGDISSSTKSFIATALPMLLHACAAISFKSSSTTIAASSPRLPSFAHLTEHQAEIVVYEYLEQYITQRLYRRIFSIPSNIDMDTALCEHILQFQFITPANLDIDDALISNERLEQIQEQLLRMTSFKTPREKLIALKKGFKLLFKLLSNDKNSAPVGADQLLPIIIYVLIKSNLPFLLSNIQFITLFRDPSLIEPETNYYLVTLITGATFIQNMTMDQLTMSNDKDNDKVNEVEVQQDKIEDNKPKQDVEVDVKTDTEQLVPPVVDSSTTITSDVNSTNVYSSERDMEKEKEKEMASSIIEQPPDVGVNIKPVTVQSDRLKQQHQHQHEDKQPTQLLPINGSNNGSNNGTINGTNGSSDGGGNKGTTVIQQPQQTVVSTMPTTPKKQQQPPQPQPQQQQQQLQQQQTKRSQPQQQHWKFYKSRPEDLSIKDVRQLMVEYNQLVDHWYSTTAAAPTVAGQSPRSNK